MDSPKKKVTISLDSKVFGEFQKYCEENAIIVSKKVEIWMNNFIKEVKNGNKKN